MKAFKTLLIMLGLSGLAASLGLLLAKGLYAMDVVGPDGAVFLGNFAVLFLMFAIAAGFEAQQK
jgi:hypothetical protein